MKRVIITGASGFVGANLVRRLLQDGHEVHAFLRSEHNPWRIESIVNDIRRHDVDLKDLDVVRVKVRAIRPEWIFHLATYGAYSTQDDSERMIGTNIVGTVNLVNACLDTGFDVFVNTGSSSEYGWKDHPPGEGEMLEPNSAYGVTKAAATLFCQFTAGAERVRIPTLRLYSVYGPFEEPARFIPTLICRGLRGELPPLVSPAVARDYVHVDDVCDAYLRAATCSGKEPGAIYNIGTGTQTSMSHAIDTARRVMAISAEPVWGSMGNRQWDTDVWVADNSKAKRELGWQPRVDFAEGLRLTIDWLQQHPNLRQFYEDKVLGSMAR